MMSSSQDDVASFTDGTTKTSDEISEYDISDAQAQAWNLTALAKKGLIRRRFIPALCFAVAAAGIFGIQPVRAATAVASGSSTDWRAILEKASKQALGGGRAGAIAAVVQVVTLMWLHTAVNYQMSYGGDLKAALKALYAQGGLCRFYQGLPLALVSAPLSRFGDTAANVGVLALLDDLPRAAGLPLPLKTAAATLAACWWRIFCMPVDTAKTALQVEGKPGFEKLKRKILKQGPGPLYQGSLANAGAHLSGHYPWYLTYNFLDGKLPPVPRARVLVSLIRSALIGLSASCAASAVSNSLRVVKTTQQTALLKAEDPPSGLGEETSDGEGSETRAAAGENATDPKSISFGEALTLVIEADGIKGLFGRGLKTRLLLNSIQSVLFTVLWKLLRTPGSMR